MCVCVLFILCGFVLFFCVVAPIRFLFCFVFVVVNVLFWKDLLFFLFYFLLLFFVCVCLSVFFFLTYVFSVYSVLFYVFVNCFIIMVFLVHLSIVCLSTLFV